MSGLPDLSVFFEKYESLQRGVDEMFKMISRDHSEQVKCTEGCSDCCHALFDLSLIEALYINNKFNSTFSFGPERSDILERASACDREVHKLKRDFFKQSQSGISATEIFEEVSRIRIRCPLLGDDNRCRMYESRPLICRIYGIPVTIGGKSHCCGKARFLTGRSYPSISLDTLSQHMVDISQELTRHTGSKYNELHEVFVPLSMALITKYNNEYLGINVKAGSDA